MQPLTFQILTVFSWYDAFSLFWRSFTFNLLLFVESNEVASVQQLTIIPRMGEDKGAVRVQMDYIKFEMSALRYMRLLLMTHTSDTENIENKACSNMDLIVGQSYTSNKHFAVWF